MLIYHCPDFIVSTHFACASAIRTIRSAKEEKKSKKSSKKRDRNARSREREEPQKKVIKVEEPVNNAGSVDVDLVKKQRNGDTHCPELALVSSTAPSLSKFPSGSSSKQVIPNR
jgi:hypothetical protein